MAWGGPPLGKTSSQTCSGLSRWSSRSSSRPAMASMVGNYELVRKIGEGGYGKIFLGRAVMGVMQDREGGEEVVLKQVKLPTNKQEREMCLRSKHPKPYTLNPKPQTLKP